ncbi:MAG: hypothetical protein ACKO7Z_05755, partial [Cyanobacteriota bacterium]
VLPLLFLLTLQLVALLNLLNPALGQVLAPLAGATLSLSLVWAGLNTGLLLLALRCCWDRPGLSEQPWFALRMPCRLQAMTPAGEEGDPSPRATALVGAELEAISARGVELRLTEPMGPVAAGAQPARPLSDRSVSMATRMATWIATWMAAWMAASRPGSQPSLVPGGGGATLTLQLPRLPPLPVCVEVRQRQRLGCTWGALSDRQREQLQSHLYRRPNLWPIRRAPLEPLALLVVLGRLLIGCRTETWFCRSALPQQPAQGPES